MKQECLHERKHLPSVFVSNSLGKFWRQLNASRMAMDLGRIQVQEQMSRDSVLLSMLYRRKYQHWETSYP